MSDAKIRILYDGDCPLCSREMETLRRRDAGRGRLAFEDIASKEFDPARHGLTQEQVMARMHGVLPDGTVVDGVEVFRRAYQAVGLGWLLAWTRLPGLRRLADAGYAWFARNRLRLTGREEACDDACTPPALADGGRGEPQTDSTR